MTATETKQPYIDQSLMVEAELLGNGASVHNVRSLLHGYRLACELVVEGKDDGTLAAKLERYADDLRIAIAEHKAKPVRKQR